MSNTIVSSKIPPTKFESKIVSPPFLLPPTEISKLPPPLLFCGSPIDLYYWGFPPPKIFNLGITGVHDLCYSLYSQTCSNDHLYKTITRLRRSMLSSPKQIPKQSLLHKTTTCLTWPATTFLSPRWKKACLKQPLQNFTQRRNVKQTWGNRSVFGTQSKIHGWLFSWKMLAAKS